MAERSVAPEPPTDPLALVRQALGRARADTLRHGGLLAVDDAGPAYDSAQALIWTTDSALTSAAGEALDLLRRAPEFGLPPTAYHGARLASLADSLRLLPGRTAAARRAGARSAVARQRAAFDLLLTDAVLALMRHLHRGFVRPFTPSPLETKAKIPLQPAALLQRTLRDSSLTATVLALQPPNREYQELQRALAAWLREPPADSAARDSLYRRAAVNLERWRWEPIADTAYLLINLPAYELRLQGARRVWSKHRVIIGKPETPTPTLSSRLGYFTTAPEWRVPNSIIAKEILPRLQRDPGYLARNGFALYDRTGQRLLDPMTVRWRRVTMNPFPYVIRQIAGCDNSLGNVVFRFANPYDIYLHDTPLRQYFAWPKRAFSHGCVRVEKPLALAALLLRRDRQDTVDLPTEEACAFQTRPRDYHLKRPVPLHLRYATCVAENGKLRFFADIYGRDAVISQQLFGTENANRLP